MFLSPSTFIVCTSGAMCASRGGLDGSPPFDPPTAQLGAVRCQRWLAEAFYVVAIQPGGKGRDVPDASLGIRPQVVAKSASVQSGRI